MIFYGIILIQYFCLTSWHFLQKYLAPEYYLIDLCKANDILQFLELSALIIYCVRYITVSKILRNSYFCSARCIKLIKSDRKNFNIGTKIYFPNYFNIDNNKTLNTKSAIMIFDVSCDTEDWSINAKISALLSLEWIAFKIY